MSWLTEFEKEEQRLWAFYPNEPKFDGDASVWYSGDVIRLFDRSEAQALASTVRTLGMGDAAPYWSPPADQHDHMRHLAAERESLDRLVPVTPENGKRVNPNFSRFPVRYQQALAVFEIDDTVRLATLGADLIEVQRANYLDQLTTNIWPDKVPAGTSQSLRATATVHGRLAPLSRDSRLANTLGAAVVLIDRDGVPLLRFRGRPGQKMDGSGERVAVMANGWHCAASGATTWQDLDWASVHDNQASPQWLLHGVERGMWRELREETGLLPSDGISMRPLALVRELKRAGKPNFFFVATAHDKTCADLQRLIEERNAPDKDEYSRGNWHQRFSLLKPSTWTDGQPVAFLVLQALRLDLLASQGFAEASTTGFTYENYAALRLAARWWRATGGAA